MVLTKIHMFLGRRQEPVEPSFRWSQQEPNNLQRGAQAKRQQEKGELGSSKFETKALTRTAFPWQGALSAVR